MARLHSNLYRLRQRFASTRQSLQPRISVAGRDYFFMRWPDRKCFALMHLTWIIMNTVRIAQACRHPWSGGMRIWSIAILALSAAACAPAVAQSPWNEAALDDLEAVAAATELEGLPREDIALAELARFRHMAVTDPAAEAQTDIAADALFRSLARSFSQGGADPARADPDWAIPLSAAPDLDALAAARDAGALPSTLLRPLLPANDDYLRLRAELARVREEAGDDDTRIEPLRASLERWRWLPRTFADRRLEVRIPQYELRFLSGGDANASHRVIVGALDSQTPSFVAEIASVTFNPSWEPPASIAAELLARFRRDPAAAAREGFEALDANGEIVADVDWDTRPFGYRLRQRPGPANALGRIRFDMANDFAIRLHDTPSRTLFARDQRALSHGCIRVEAPEALAVGVLGREEWTLAAVDAAIEAGDQQIVTLGETLPVYLLYITASVSEDGEIAYARDIYRRDRAIVAALDGPDVALARRAAAQPARCPAEASIP